MYRKMLFSFRSHPNDFIQYLVIFQKYVFVPDFVLLDFRVDVGGMWVEGMILGLFKGLGRQKQEGSKVVHPLTTLCPV